MTLFSGVKCDFTKCELTKIFARTRWGMYCQHHWEQIQTYHDHNDFHEFYRNCTVCHQTKVPERETTCFDCQRKYGNGAMAR